MRKIHSTLIAIGFLAAITGCDRPTNPTADDAEREVSQRSQQADEVALTERDTYLENLQQDLDEIDQHMESMISRASELTEDERGEWEDHKGLLAERMRQVHGKVDQLNQSSGEDWEKLQYDIEQSLDAFRIELREVLERQPHMVEPTSTS